MTVAVEDVVLDDVLAVGPGDQLSVDGMVLEGTGLEVDESLLSGEAEPVLKAPGAEVRSGSFVVAGTGRAQATKVGRDAYARTVTDEARRFELVRSELRMGIDRILRLVTWVLVPTAVLLVWSQLTLGDDLAGTLRGSVAGVGEHGPRRARPPDEHGLRRRRGSLGPAGRAGR